MFIIDGYHGVQYGVIDGNGFYLSVFYCIFFIKERTVDMLE